MSIDIGDFIVECKGTYFIDNTSVTASTYYVIVFNINKGYFEFKNINTMYAIDDTQLDNNNLYSKGYDKVKNFFYTKNSTSTEYYRIIGLLYSNSSADGFILYETLNNVVKKFGELTQTISGDIIPLGSVGASISHDNDTGEVTTLHKTQINASDNSRASAINTQINSSFRTINNTNYSSVWGYNSSGDVLESNQTIRLESIDGNAFFKGKVRIGINDISSPNGQVEKLLIGGDTKIQGNITANNISPTREIFGLRLINNALDSNNDIDFSAGWCFDDTYISNPTTAKYMTNLFTIVKQLDTTFAEGTNQGMLQSGQTKQSNMSYFIYMIAKEDGTVDFLATQYSVAVSLPTGFTKKRRIGLIMTDSSGNIIQFNHYPEEKTYYYKTKVSITDWPVPTTETAVYVDVPRGVSVKPIIQVTPGTPTNVSSLCYSIRGVERNFSDFLQSNMMSGNYSGEFSSRRYELAGFLWEFAEGYYSKDLITTTDGELYFMRKGNYYSTSHYSTRHIYGFIDFSV